jgi:hypothetical protein
MSRRAINVIGTGELHDAAEVHDRDAVGHLWTNRRFQTPLDDQ